VSGPTAEQLAGKPPVEQVLRDRLQLLVGEATMAAFSLEGIQAWPAVGGDARRALLELAAALRGAAAEAAEPVG
jgi:hypothetical protein